MAATGRTVLILRQTIVLVYAGLVIIGVTTRTIGLVARRRPVDHVRIVLVALGAIEVAAVILRLIRKPGVPVVSRQPRDRAVTLATVLRGIEVAGVLSGGRSAIVARRTGAENLVVVHRCNRRPNRRAVAIFADVGCLDVSRSLTDGIGAIVATNTVIHDVDVVEVSGQPRDCRMAVIAVIAAGDMRWVFAGRYCAVMTGAAGANDLDVVDRVNRYPDVRGMAVFANIGRLNMRQVLARSVGAVMAAGTVARNIYVIEIRRQPADG